MKNVLITGSSGLIGSIIYQNLKHKYKFTGLDKIQNNKTGINTHIVKSNNIDEIRYIQLINAISTPIEP